MDWRTTNFDWNRARAFLVTAEEGSFSAAARALGTTQPTVGRQVTQLEEELGVTLFERVAGGLMPTQAALDLLEHVRAMGIAATRVSLVAAGKSEAVSGNVSVTASEAISAYLLPDVVASLRQSHPGITLDLVVSNDARDLQRREADIAVRNFNPTQPELIVRKLGQSMAHIYAAPSYLERVGPLNAVQDLARAEFLGFDHSTTMIDGLKAIMGIDAQPAQFPIVTSNHLVQWAMCKRGIGLCIMMAQVGDAEPEVVKVLPHLGIPIPLYVVSHRELLTSRRIRLVFDALVSTLSSPPLPPSPDSP